MSDTAEGLTFVLPLLNQEKELEKVLGNWITALNACSRPYEILLIDDGSTDGTQEIAERLSARNKRIKLHKHPTHRGFGAAVRTALEHATQPLFFFVSCDPNWATSDLARMLKHIELRDEYTNTQVQIVNGHRRGLPVPKWRARRQKAWGYFHRIVTGNWPEPSKGWLGNEEERFWWRCRLQFGLRLGDINCPFKLFRRPVFDKMILQSEGNFIHAEILAKANFLGTLMDEIVLSDRVVIAPLADMSDDRKQVFNNPRFRSPVPLLSDVKVEPTPEGSEIALVPVEAQSSLADGVKDPIESPNVPDGP